MYWNFPLDVLWLLAGVSLLLREMFVGPIALNTGLTPAKPYGVWFPQMPFWPNPRWFLLILAFFPPLDVGQILVLLPAEGRATAKISFCSAPAWQFLSQTVAGSATQYWAGRSSRYPRTPWCQITHPKLLAPSQTITRPELPSCEIRTLPEGSQRSVPFLKGPSTKY